MPADLTASIIRILDVAQNTVGTGFVLTPSLAVTCAHVVKAAGSSPGQPLNLRFYCGNVPTTALVHSQGYASVETDDVAFIELDCLPSGVEPVTLAQAAGRSGHLYHAFGFARLAEYAERHVTGATIGGLVNHPNKQPMLQLNGDLIKHGLSGGPVLDTDTGQVVGMISEFADDVGDKAHSTARLNWATTADILALLWSGLPLSDKLPPENPFFIGGRINDPRHFFGRERLLREIRNELKKRSCVSLVGESQLGKSSLLYYLYLTRAEWLPDVTVRFIDLQEVLNEADFCETVLAKLDSEGDSLRDLKRILRQREVVLLFDEIERLAEPDFNPRLHDLLRSLAQEPHFAMALTSHRPLVEVFPARTQGGVSPFHNIFTLKTLLPFTQTETETFLSQRLASAGISFTPVEQADLWAKSQGHPAILQRLAYTLFAAKVEL